MGRRFDIDAESRRVLEFEPLLRLVAGYARSPLGVRAVLGLEPAGDAAQVRRELDLVEETVQHRVREGDLVPAGLPEVESPEATLGVEGAGLPAATLRDLAVVLLASSEAGLVLRGLSSPSFPLLRAEGQGFPDLRAEARVIARSIDDRGRLHDDASPELRRIRREQNRLGERLRRVLSKRLRGPGSEHVIQDDFVTRRNGRFVIPVRSDAPRGVEGIVHATSSSGATQFVEPLETVELNNDLVRLNEAEQAEQQRILLRWTDALRGRSADVVRALDRLARLDSLEARARYAAEYGALSPSVAETGPWDVRGLRHPLLEHHLREADRSCVPLDLRIEPPDSVLVLSGPNAGGKTVTLKSLGLAVLAAQSGIPVPARAVQLPLYRMLRADIGDHQSIDADLSTFSAHLQATARFVEELRAPALVLFDEIGTGTDPAEGAALARAVLERFRQPGLTTVATTHHGSLKAWAFSADGVVSAAMEFDMEALAPTYRILVGEAGISAGLEIAKRMGLSRGIIERAREHLGEDGAAAEDYILRLRRMAREADEQRRELDRRAEELERQAERRQEREERDRGRRIAALDGELGRELDGFRARARDLLGKIRDRRERERAERKLERAEHELAGRRRRAGRAAAPESATPRRPVEREACRAGLPVWVAGVERAGILEEPRGENAQVRVGAMTLTVPLSSLFHAEGSSTPPVERARDRPPSAAATPVDPVREAETELILLGRPVDDALDALDRGLDRAVLAGMVEFRVVHGHGSGRLRSAVRGFLRGHPHVDSFRAGRSHEGGDGATVVRLR